MLATKIGAVFEETAINYLQHHKLTILQRNFSCKMGEIDLIARDKNCLVFVEVRYRKSSVYGSAAESVTVSKQQKIIRAAQFYLQTRPWAQNINCRFDVLAISQSAESPQIEWIKDAFDA